MRQLLAAWLVIDEHDLPMNPRLLGKPGVGKTTLAYAAAQRLGREVFILQATVDTRPEDLLITPVIEGAAKLRYVASPLVSAMLRGGIVILDEGNRNEREKLGQPRAVAGQSPLRGVHCRQHQDQGAPSISTRSYDERRCQHL